MARLWALGIEWNVTGFPCSGLPDHGRQGKPDYWQMDAFLGILYRVRSSALAGKKQWARGREERRLGRVRPAVHVQMILLGQERGYRAIRSLEPRSWVLSAEFVDLSH